MHGVVPVGREVVLECDEGRPEVVLAAREGGVVLWECLERMLGDDLAESCDGGRL